LLAASGGSTSLVGSDQQLTLQPSLYRAFKHLIDDLSAGKPVCLVTEEELTTQAAADLLNVSRPYFIKLLEIVRLLQLGAELYGSGFGDSNSFLALPFRR